MPLPPSVRRVGAYLRAPVTMTRSLRRLFVVAGDNNRRLADLQRSVDDIRQVLTRDVDDRLTVLRRLLAQVEPYQPIYGLAGLVPEPARASADRARAIEVGMSGVRGKRILDIGSSLGYMSFYFADRGAHVTGWEYNAANTEVARHVGEVTGIPVTFVTKELTLETVRSIEPGAYDYAFVLAVFHHIIHFQGLDAAQQILTELLDRVPVVFLELASRGEDPDLFWDAAQPDDPLTLLDPVRERSELTRLGTFTTHLSTHRRPIYRLARPQVVRVGDHEYAFDSVSREAYRNSPVSEGPWRRRYYHSATHVIKEYDFTRDAEDNWRQIIGELYVHTLLSSGGPVHHALVVDDVHLDHDHALVAMRRIEGHLLSEGAPLGPAALRTVVTDVLTTLRDLRAQGVHHNDVRSWNILVAPDGGGWLIDYGRAAHVPHEDDVVALAWAAVAGSQGGRESAEEAKTTLPSDADLEKAGLVGFGRALRDGVRDPGKLLDSLID